MTTAPTPCTRCGGCDTYRENKLSAGFHRKIWFCVVCNQRFTPKPATMLPMPKVEPEPIARHRGRPRKAAPVEREKIRAVAYVLTFATCPECVQSLQNRNSEWRCWSCGYETADAAGRGWEKVKP